MKKRSLFPTVPAVSFLTAALVLLFLLVTCSRSYSKATSNFAETRTGTPGAAQAPVRAAAVVVRPSQMARCSSSLKTSPQAKDACRSSLENCSEESQDNDHIYDEIWLLVDQHFLYRERLSGWASLRHKFDGRMKTRAASQKAINSMLDWLEDEYTFFRDESATEQRKCLRQKTNVVEHRMLDGNIGYLRITTFNSQFCLAETRNALVALSPAHALVLDLRDNWGGSINTAFDVFSMLVGQGKFVTMKGTTDSAEYVEELFLEESSEVTVSNGLEKRCRRGSNQVFAKPLVALVNGNTKSAAEMLAGALRDNQRACILGTRTYGKGIVQRVWEFPNHTSIKISSARFYLPSGEFIHQVGMNPDLTVVGSDVALTASCRAKAEARKPRAVSRAADDSQHSSAYPGAGNNNRLARNPVSPNPEGSASALRVSGSFNCRHRAHRTWKCRDRQLVEAQSVLKQKLVSLAQP